MRKIRSAVLLLLTALIVACESGLDTRYLDASLGDRLELPPDLQEYDAKAKFELPDSFSGTDESERDKIPVLARVESLHLQGDGDLYWLVVEEPVENLYQQVKNYWSSEGYRLVVDEPVIGLMQTEWIYREEGTRDESGSWFENLFSSADLFLSQNQFRTRIERGEQGQSRIYLTHRGSEYVYLLDRENRSPVTDIDANEEWRFRQPEPELEIEMLSRLMVYLGLQRDNVDRQFEGVKLFAPRAFMHVDTEENSPFLILKDAYQIAWNRVYHNLERMNFKIDSAEFKSGLMNEGVIVVSAKTTGTDQDSLFSVFTSQLILERQVVLILSEVTHEFTRVEIETEKGEIDTSPEGAEFMRLLYRQIK